jgi:pyrimidine operon attenuation protein/uracil phosphoribosyltransferase
VTFVHQASELQRVKSTQQSTDVLISMQSEVAKLEAEILRLQESKNVSSSAFDIELFKDNLEAEKQQVR